MHHISVTLLYNSHWLLGISFSVMFNIQHNNYTVHIQSWDFLCKLTGPLYTEALILLVNHNAITYVGAKVKRVVMQDIPSRVLYSRDSTKQQQQNGLKYLLPNFLTMRGYLQDKAQDERAWKRVFVFLLTVPWHSYCDALLEATELTAVAVETDDKALAVAEATVLDLLLYTAPEESLEQKIYFNLSYIHLGIIYVLTRQR